MMAESVNKTKNIFVHNNIIVRIVNIFYDSSQIGSCVVAFVCDAGLGALLCLLCFCDGCVSEKL